MGKGNSLVIKVEENLHELLKVISQKQGSKLEDEVTKAIKSYIELTRAYSNDSFFQIGKAGKSGLKDMTKARDKYLYGREERE